MLRDFREPKEFCWGSRSLYYWLFAPHIYGCYSSRTSRSCWTAHSTQRQPRGCKNRLPIVSLVFAMLTQNRHCLSVSQNMRQVLRWKRCHRDREPVTLLEVIKTGAIRLPLNFSVTKFLPKLPKALKFGRHTLHLWQMIPNKIL